MFTDTLSDHYSGCDVCRFDEPCSTWTAMLDAHRRATTTKARYLSAWHEARATVRRAVLDGDSYTNDGLPVYRALDGLVDRFTYADPSVVGPAVRQAVGTAPRFVGPTWRAMARRDIPGRYPRLDIP